MRFTDIFVKRPVLSTVLSVLILLVGLQALQKLQIRQFPELANTTISVSTAYPGANADVIKGFITTQVEQAVASAEGIDTLESSSRQNISSVTLNLKLNADADRAVVDVLSKINQVQDLLPTGASDPVVAKQSGDSTALFYLAFESRVMSSPQITDYLTRVVEPKLQTVDGVSNAQILGGQKLSMRVWLDPVRMAALGITPTDVAVALQSNNFTSAAGEVKGDFVQISVNAETSLDSQEEFERLVVVARGETLIRLSDIAQVELGPQSVSSSSIFDGAPAVFVGIFATPSANPLTVINDVRALVPEIQRELPVGLKATIAYDSTEFIRSSIDEVVTTLWQAGLIVIIVIFLFLGNLRATLIPIVTIPLSLIGVLIVLQLLGFSINLLTLLALVLAIGLVVDDAIVVVENTYRHIEAGLTPFDAALTGAREIAGPVITMTITLAAVYAPIALVSGLTGALFIEFALTLAGAVIVSGIVALTLSPMMCAHLLSRESTEGRFSSAVDRFFGWLRDTYRSRLSKTLNFRAMTVLILTGIVVATAMLFLATPKELAPQEDQGILFAQVEAPQYANLDYLEQTTGRLAKELGAIPEIENIFAFNGLSSPNSAFFGFLLKPWGDRSRSAAQVLGEMQPAFFLEPSAQVIGFQPPALPGSSGGTPVQFVVTTTNDFQELAGIVAKLQQTAQQSGLFLFTSSDLKFNTPQIQLSIDQDKANLLGISMEDIGLTLSSLLGDGNVNFFNLQGRSYEVIPQVPRDFRLDAEWLGRYHVRTASGDLIPLSAVTSVSSDVQPNALTTFQQLNSATLSGVPFPGRTLGEALDFLRTTADETFPEGYTYDFKGQSRQFIEEGSSLTTAFIFAIIVIYLVLAAQFESFRDPFIILIALPTSMFGALLPVYLLSLSGQASVNIYTQIGLVTLIGLLSKHGILMVEFANKLQEDKGVSRRAAITEAAAVRLRPILMTTTSMVVAMVPLLVATGAGASSRFAIGLVIAGGMTVGTLFTLFVTPAVYTLIARDHGGGATETPEPETPEPETPQPDTA